MKCLLLCIFFAPAIRFGAAGISLEVIPGRFNFIEDKITIFSCHVLEAERDDEVTWVIRDPNTEEKILYSYSLLDESRPMKLDKRNRTKFSLWMRRDFSHMEIVCRTTRRKQSASRILEEVQKTIPIENVEFNSTDLVHGQPLRLFCVVKANPAVIKLVDFREKSSMALANKKDVLPDQQLVRYELSAPQLLIEVKNLDGKLMQCIAAKDGFKKHTGNVVSRWKRVTVHSFEHDGPKSTQHAITQGSVLKETFKVFCNPEPRANQFFLMPATGNVKGIKITIQKAPGRYEFLIQVEFTPQVAANYHIYFGTNFLKRRKVISTRVVFIKPANVQVNQIHSTRTSNQTAVFSCKISHGHPSVRIVWLIRDPITNRTLWNSKYFNVTEVNGSFTANSPVIPVSYYFEKDIVCVTSPSGEEGSFRLTDFVDSKEEDISLQKLWWILCIVRIGLPLLLLCLFVVLRASVKIRRKSVDDEEQNTSLSEHPDDGVTSDIHDED